MSMGEEETKGSELVREVHEVLKASSLNFVGNVEGHDVFTGKVDVVVMDGFTGNVVLKACETLAELVIDLIREEVGRDVRGQVGAFLLEARLPRRATAQRPGRDRRRAAPRPQGLLRDRPRKGEGRAPSSTASAPPPFFHSSGVNAAIEAELRALGERKEAASA